MTLETRTALEKALNDYEEKNKQNEIKNMTKEEADVYLRDILSSYFGRNYHLHAILMAREALKENSSLIEQAISKCHLSKMHGNPDVEEGMCSGFRTLDGQGEPCDECKECKLQYLYKDTH